MRKQDLSMFLSIMNAVSRHYSVNSVKYRTKRHERSNEFIAESKELAEQKRQRRCERNLRLKVK